MAVSTIKSNKGVIYRKTIRVLENANASSAYIEPVAGISVNGYVPIALGYKLNQTVYSVYWAELDAENNRAKFGIRNMTGGNVSNLTLDALVTYIRKDFE